jgi:hypothetical protein
MGFRRQARGMRNLFSLAMVATAAMALAGCGSGTTETGYEPHKLGLSDAQLKGLYAPRYSVQQAKAQAEQEAENKSRKPTMFQ